MQNYKENPEETELNKRMLENTLDGCPYVNIDQWVETMRNSYYDVRVFFNKDISEKIEKETLDKFWEGAGFYPFS